MPAKDLVRNILIIGIVMWSYISKKLDNYYLQNLNSEMLDENSITTEECIQRLEDITLSMWNTHTVDSYGRLTPREGYITAIFKGVFGGFLPLDKSSRMRLREGALSIQKMIDKVDRNCPSLQNKEAFFDHVRGIFEKLVHYEIKNELDRRLASLWVMKQDRERLSSKKTLEKNIEVISLDATEKSIEEIPSQQSASAFSAKPASYGKDVIEPHFDLSTVEGGGLQDDIEDEMARQHSDEASQSQGKETAVEHAPRRSSLGSEPQPGFFPMETRSGTLVLPKEVEENSMILRDHKVLPKPSLVEEIHDVTIEGLPSQEEGRDRGQEERDTVRSQGDPIGQGPSEEGETRRRRDPLETELQPGFFPMETRSGTLVLPEEVLENSMVLRDHKVLPKPSLSEEGASASYALPFAEGVSEEQIGGGEFHEIAHSDEGPSHEHGHQQTRRRSSVEIETPSAFYATQLRDGKVIVPQEVEQHAMITRSGLVIPDPVIIEKEE